MFMKNLLFSSLQKSLKFQSVVNFSVNSIRSMKYLNQTEAINVDQELFNDYKFSVFQLMELAGLSVSHSIFKEFPPEKLKSNKVLIAVGPGNNGGDGLVAARHLTLFNYKCAVYYPKRTDNQLYQDLLHQCKSMDVEILDNCPDLNSTNKEYGLIIDSLFGFSFKPPVRESFQNIMDLLKKTSVPIMSVDIPSGWDVENGPGNSTDCINPAMLISLTAPKLCAKHFNGIHYIGGRFVPASLATKYNLDLPQYPGSDCCVKI